MTQCTEAERYMLDGIRRGDAQAWAQVVERYQGRLVAYARHRCPRGLDAEDLVQDTFLRFLRGVAGFREEASLETFLFVILRRSLADVLRSKRLPAGDLPEQDALPANDLTASRYARRDEQRDAAREILADALRSLVKRMQDKLSFGDLQVLELLFCAQKTNQQIAEQIKGDAAHIALLKHRWLKELREHVAERAKDIPWEESAALESLLTETWAEVRPSCPKRSTIGSYLLGTLDDDWQRYIDFHVTTVACPFCQANLEDLRQQTQQDSATLRQRIMQSTVGFFGRSKR
jgi:RNA polymerase sigma factor (sigma-70 family)